MLMYFYKNVEKCLCCLNKCSRVSNKIVYTMGKNVLYHSKKCSHLFENVYDTLQYGAHVFSKTLLCIKKSSACIKMYNVYSKSRHIFKK